ncbi:MAG: helix-turn-helix transcriptional regulator [Planctomycetes bacterium]|nr:helix-turn-helix transcriptional regulator [Planctomycetota bacterium]
MSLGKAIKLARIQCGVSQKDLASRTGIPIWTLSKIETGRTVRIRPDNLRVITEVLGTSTDALMAQVGGREVDSSQKELERRISDLDERLKILDEDGLAKIASYIEFLIVEQRRAPVTARATPPSDTAPTR